MAQDYIYVEKFLLFICEYQQAPRIIIAIPSTAESVLEQGP